MIDRQPTRPGRVKITPEDGSPAFYGTMEMADEPTELGTPLNKENLLKDATAALLSLSPTATPDDFLKKVAEEISALLKGSFTFVTGATISNQSREIAINLGFKPQIVVIYGEKNNEVMVCSGGTSFYYNVPIILTPAFSAGLNKITNKGFIYNGYYDSRYHQEDDLRVKYIAFRAGG